MADGKPSYSFPGMVTSSTLESALSILAAASAASKKTSNHKCLWSEHISMPCEPYNSRPTTQSGDEADQEHNDVACSYTATSRPRPMLGIYLGSTQNNSRLNAATTTFTMKSPSAGSLLSPSSTTSLSPHVQPVASSIFQPLSPPILQPLTSPVLQPLTSPFLQPVAAPVAAPVPVSAPNIFPSYFVDVEVQLKPGYADVMLTNRVGVVRKVSGKTATVYIRANSSCITIPHDSLVPVHPRLSDTVKVIGGSECMLGLIGTLLSIPVVGKEGLVQFLSWNNRKRNSMQISLSYLGRYLPASKFCSDVSSFSSGGFVLNDSITSTSTTRNGQVSYPSTVQLVQISPAHSSSSLRPLSFFNTQQPSSSLTFSGSGLPLSFSMPPSSRMDSPLTSSAVSSTFSGSTTPPHIVNLSRSNAHKDEDERDSISVGQCFHSFMTTNKRPSSKSTLVNQVSTQNGFDVSNNRNMVFSRQAALEPSSSRAVSMHQPCFVSSSTGASMLQNTTKDIDKNKRLLSRLTEIQHRLHQGSVFGRGGGTEEHSTSDMIERLVRTQRDYVYEMTTPTSPGGGAHDVKTSCVRVSLVCPLSQQRMKYPSRGKSCKHFQCFDAENYINFHKKQIFRYRLKRHHHKAVLDKSWNCPICEKMTPMYHIYIDRALMKLVDKTNATEVELKDDGSWAPVKKNVAVVVIDLTGDD